MKIKSVVTGLFLVPFLLWTSCENLNDAGNTSEKNSISFIIKSGENKQKVYVYKTLKSYEEINNTFLENVDKFLVEDADIEIINGSNIINDFEVEKYSIGNWTTSTPTKYYINKTDYEILPLTGYELRIKANGQEITGNSETPGDFNITNHDAREVITPGSTIHKINIPLQWTASMNAKFYSVKYHKAKIDSVYRADELYITKYDFDWPTSEVWNTIFETNYTIEIPTDADSIKVDITAYDENAYKHFVLGHDMIGITNAHGAFGAAVVRSVVFIIKK